MVSEPQSLISNAVNPYNNIKICCEIVFSNDVTITHNPNTFVIRDMFKLDF